MDLVAVARNQRKIGMEKAYGELTTANRDIMVELSTSHQDNFLPYFEAQSWTISLPRKWQYEQWTELHIPKCVGHYGSTGRFFLKSRITVRVHIRDTKKFKHPQVHFDGQLTFTSLENRNQDDGNEHEIRFVEFSIGDEDINTQSVQWKQLPSDRYSETFTQPFGYDIVDRKTRALSWLVDFMEGEDVTVKCSFMIRQKKIPVPRQLLSKVESVIKKYLTTSSEVTRKMITYVADLNDANREETAELKVISGTKVFFADPSKFVEDPQFLNWDALKRRDMKEFSMAESSAEGVEQFLVYCYCGDAQNLRRNAPELFVIAHQNVMDALRITCEIFMVEKVLKAKVEGKELEQGDLEEMVKLARDGNFGLRLLHHALFLCGHFL